MGERMRTLVAIGVLLALASPGSADTFDDNIVYRPSAGQWFLSHNAGSGGADPYYPALGGAPAPVTSTTGWGVSGVHAPLIGDVNGDGFDDIIAVDPSAGNYGWLAGHSIDAGGGAAAIGSQSFPAADSALGGFGTVAGNLGNYLGDVNNDGTDDAITINAGFNWYSNLSGVGTGLGAGPTSGPAQFGLAGDQPILGDFNGDGAKDIGVYRPGGGNIFWNGTGAGGALGGLGLGPIGQIGGGATDSLLIGNLNGDAFDDAVMVRQTGAGLIQWFGLINDGTGSLDYFNPGTTIVNFGLDGPDTPFLADINGDGMDDIGIERGGSQHFVTFTTAGGALGTSAAGDETWAFGGAGDIQMYGDFNIIPEPGTLALLGLGGLMLIRRRRA